MNNFVFGPLPRVDAHGVVIMQREPPWKLAQLVGQGYSLGAIALAEVLRWHAQRKFRQDRLTLEQPNQQAALAAGIQVRNNHRIAATQEALARGEPVSNAALLYMAPGIRYTLPSQFGSSHGGDGTLTIVKGFRRSTGRFEYYIRVKWSQSFRPYLEMIRDQLADLFNIHDGNIYSSEDEDTHEIYYELEYVSRASLLLLLPFMMQHNPMKGLQAQLAYEFLTHNFDNDANPQLWREIFWLAMQYLNHVLCYDNNPALIVAVNPDFAMDDGFISGAFDTDGIAKTVRRPNGTLRHSVGITFTKYPHMIDAMFNYLGYGSVYDVYDNNLRRWKCRKLAFTSRHEALRFYMQFRHLLTRKLGEFEDLLPLLMGPTLWRLDNYLKYAQAHMTQTIDAYRPYVL